MSSNFFQFTQIWHFCNGLNPNKAQMSFVWGWNRQMGKKRETEKALSSIFSWDFWKMTLPLAYHLEFSVFFAKWNATLSGLSISMFFVQLQRSHMVEVTRKILDENNNNHLSACLQCWFRVFFFCKIFFFFSWAVFSHSIAWKSFFLPSKKGEILKKVNNWKRPWKTALSDSFPTIWFSFQIACDTKRKFDLASRVTVLQIFPRKYWSVFITLARIYLFHTSCTSGLFKLFPNNQTDDNTGLARTAVPCGQFKLV